MKIHKPHVLLSEEDKQQLMTDYLNNIKIKDLIEKYNVQRTTIYNVVKNIPKRLNITKRTFLTDLEKQNIIDEYQNTPIKSIELLEKYNISKPTLFRILKDIPKKGHTLTKINMSYFHTIDTSDKAYFLGFITADGSIDRRGNTLVLQFEINREDINIIEYFNKCIDSDYKITKRETYNPTGNNYTEKCKVYISNTEFVKNLITHGVTPEKSSILKIPTTIPDHLMRHYIRGLIDGDGGWHLSGKNNQNITLFFCSSVKSFAEEVQDYLCQKLQLNKVQIDSNERDTCFRFRYGGNVQCKRIYEYLYGDGGPWLERKYNRVTKILQDAKLISSEDYEYKKDLPYHTNPKKAE